MRTLLSAVLFLLLASVSARAWDCYGPQPGHPTAAERAAFVAEVSRYAVEAERVSGVPAAALAAMSIIESGYGFTRTSIEANNLFGWKYTSSSAAGGRTFYRLTCQPPEDINNRYVVFRDRAEAFQFVAGKLATLGYYAGDLARYRQARAGGSEVKAAVNAWIEGIADPYNWRPEAYARDVKQVMNNPLAPSDTLSPEANLYRLSEAPPERPATPPVVVPPTTSPAVVSTLSGPDLDYVRGLYQRSIDNGGRYMEHNCASELSYPNYEGLPVQRCEYEAEGITAVVWMLNADAERLARWTITACQDAGLSDLRTCARRLKSHIWEQSNGQFPVAGYVVEGVCYQFRDGVTVETENSSTQPIGGRCSPESAADEPVTVSKRYARIASTTREQYRAAGGTEDVGSTTPVSARKLKWLEVVRALYKQAWTSDRNQLISAWARDPDNREALQ